MLAGFEMRVREAEKYPGELAFAEKVRKELHSIGTYTGDVLVLEGIRVLCAKGTDAVLDKFSDLHTDFKTCALVIGLAGNKCLPQENSPRSSSSGNRGANATKRPPKPQPISATVTSFVIPSGFAASFSPSSGVE